MRIEFVDLKRQNQKYIKTYQKVFQKIVTSADFIQGAALADFEKNFAHFCLKSYCIGLNSGTDALLLALLAYGIGPGDEVITVPNSYFSSAMVIEHTGAKVVFADIDPQTFTISPNEVKKKITSRTRAIIPVHLYGQPVDMDPLVRLAKKHSLVIIEDCCQAHGAEYKKQIVPYTETGAFSFYPGKNLGSFGDGGAIVTNNRKVANKIRLLRNDGSLVKYEHRIFGYKSRLDTLQAAILGIKLPHLKTWNENRRKHAAHYTKLLKNIHNITTTTEASYAGHIYHIYVIETPERDALQKHLSQAGIATVIHYPTPIHLQPPYRAKGFKTGDYPITEAKSKRILSLPMFPELTESEIKQVVTQISAFFTSGV